MNSKELSLQTVQKLKNRYINLTNLKSISGSILRLILITGISYIILFPVFTKLVASVMLEKDLFDKTVLWIPKHFTLSHYFAVWEWMEYGTAFKNSFLLALTVSIIHLISASLIGYGFARFKFPGSWFVFGCVIFTIVVPPESILTALYLNFRYFNPLHIFSEPINLIGSYWPYLLMGLTGTGFRNGLYIYIMRQFFKGMPSELEEAAYVDGAGPLQTFYRVMLPGAIPALVVVFLFSFVWQWNEYIMVNFLWGKDNILPIALDGLIRSMSDDQGSEYTITYIHLIRSTGMFMFMFPLIILYTFMQRYFIESVERTGIVG